MIEKKCCGNCKHWNVHNMDGCELYIADTGEVYHYFGNEDPECPDWESMGFGKK